MNYTYKWNNPEQTVLMRWDENGNLSFVPVDPDNTDYNFYVESGAVAEEFTELPPA